jgi:DNA mismatch repair protein MutS2
LLWGIPGRSNAFLIAQRLGLKPEILDMARATVAPGASAEVNQVIAGLENQRRQQEQKNQAATRLLKETERLHQEIAQRAAKLATQEQALKQAQEQAIQAAIAQAKTEIAQVIRRLQQGSNPAQSAQQASADLNQLATKHLPKPQPKQTPVFRPRVGDRVRVPRLSQTVEVLTEPDSSGALTVRMGLMKVTVSLADIESLNGEKAELPKPKAAPPPPPPEPSLPPAIRTSQNTLDLRGKRVSEAKMALDAAIAQAQGPLWVIHGHGTGRLRQGIHEFLQQHPQVDRFEPADNADGGHGATVVYSQP